MNDNPRPLEEVDPELGELLKDYVNDDNQVETVRISDNEMLVGVVKAKIKAGRNDPCPCGSGKKFKKCCIGK